MQLVRTALGGDDSIRLHSHGFLRMSTTLSFTFFIEGSQRTRSLRPTAVSCTQRFYGNRSHSYRCFGTLLPSCTCTHAADSIALFALPRVTMERLYVTVWRGVTCLCKYTMVTKVDATTEYLRNFRISGISFHRNSVGEKIS